jgi:ABC-type transporter Mla maintaining outer membrane lipid asymmetry ATPase subunit MlaF
MDKSSHSQSPPVIEIRRLTRQFGSTKALDEISLAIPRGGVLISSAAAAARQR